MALRNQGPVANTVYPPDFGGNTKYEFAGGGGGGGQGAFPGGNPSGPPVFSGPSGGNTPRQPVTGYNAPGPRPIPTPPPPTNLLAAGPRQQPATPNSPGGYPGSNVGGPIVYQGPSNMASGVADIIQNSIQQAIAHLNK